jgi:hypothetical protein
LKVSASRQELPKNGCVAAKEHPMFGFFKTISASKSSIRSRSRRVRLAVENFEERANPGGSLSSLGDSSYTTTTTQTTVTSQVTVTQPSDPYTPGDPCRIVQY